MTAALSERPIQEYTVCGLQVDQRPCVDWNAGSYLAPGLNADGAISFTQNDLTGRVSTDRTLWCVGFALGAVHPHGEHPRLGEIESAFVSISDEYIDWALRYEPLQQYRVFGIGRTSWRTLVFDVSANGADMAYREAAVECFGRYGEPLLYVCTHAADTPYVEGYPLADPWSRYPEQMAGTLELWGAS